MRYIEKAYKLTKKIQEEESKELVRTEYGIVIANLVMFGLGQSMDNAASSQNIDKLLSWKQCRKDVFKASVLIPKNFSQEIEQNNKIEQDAKQTESEVLVDDTESEQEKEDETPA